MLNILLYNIHRQTDVCKYCKLEFLFSFFSNLVFGIRKYRVFHVGFTNLISYTFALFKIIAINKYTYLIDVTISI